MQELSPPPSDPDTGAVYDVIPDLHGHAEMLVAVLSRLGYVERAGAWRHPDPARRALFLGDFIDRGPDNAGVLDIARRMTGEGTALAIMGNHELNALLFHADDPETGGYLRPHTPEKVAQHAAFLRDFPLDAPRTRDALDWIARLPLYLDLGRLRLVHACWDAEAIAILAREVPAAGLVGETLMRCARRGDPLREAADIVLKGPEVTLPAGMQFRDRNGQVRRDSRIIWWTRSARTWADAVTSWPDDVPVPAGAIPADLESRIAASAYPCDAPPVFFGHYWLTGQPRLQAPNALCLDYSVGKGGPLVAYRFEPGDGAVLDLARLTTCRPAKAA